MLGLTERLGLDPELALPAFEDPDYFLAKGLAAAEPGHRRQQARRPHGAARLAKVFERGLDVATGYVLPIQRWQAQGAVALAQRRWETRRGKLFLVPGDSPWAFACRWAPCPGAARRARRRGAARPVRGPAALPAQRRCCSRGWPPPTAPGTPRQGLGRRGPRSRSSRATASCIFMPPTESAEEFAELVEAIEDTAAEIDLPVHRGLPAPGRPALNVIKVTPDPGVIEVNIHPSHSWEEQVAITEALYEEARLSRLDTCKF